MATITIRNISVEIYECLKERARSNRRSITQEAAFIIEQAVGSPGVRDQAPWVRVERVREQIRTRYGSFPDSAPLIAEDRQR